MLPQEMAPHSSKVAWGEGQGLKGGTQDTKQYLSTLFQAISSSVQQSTEHRKSTQQMLVEWMNEKTGQGAQATLTYSFLNGDFVIVSDWVLSQEVKLYHVFLTIQLWVQIDVLHTKWAATHSVRCFSFLLLIACS